LILIVRGLIYIYFGTLCPNYYREWLQHILNDEKAYLERIGNQIRELRIEADLSQEKLAFECELDRTYIGSVERGERNISVINLRKIAKALKTKVPVLLNIEE
jgi:DNA-binding XRE family transcriptional regulator